MSRRVTIGLKDDVYSRLRKKGRFGESFSELVARVLDDFDEVEEDINR